MVSTAIFTIWHCQYGAVKDIRLAQDKNGQSKGFAFVEFQNEVSIVEVVYDHLMVILRGTPMLPFLRTIMN